MLHVHGGSLGVNVPATLKTTLSGTVVELIVSEGLGRIHRIPASEIQRVEIVTEQNRSSLAGAIKGGAVGALLAGPVGLLAGSLLTGRRAMMTALVHLCRDRQLLISGPADDLTKLLAAAVTTQAKAPKPPPQRRKTPTEPTVQMDGDWLRFPCDYCAAALKAPATKTGAELSCPICDMPLIVPGPPIRG